MTIKYKTPDGQVVEVEGRLFVCRDRKGKDVYAGDAVRARQPAGDGEQRSMTVVWQREELQWYLTCGWGEWPVAESLDSIELIEDQP